MVRISARMYLAGNKAKRLSLVNHTTKTIHHHSSSSLINFEEQIDSQTVFHCCKNIGLEFGTCKSDAHTIKTGKTIASQHLNLSSKE